jgi:hypothetical protein
MISCDWLAYDTIQMKNMEEITMARRANNSMEASTYNPGSFVAPTDGLLAFTGMSIFRGNKSITITSFDPLSLECRGCSSHHDKKV